MILPGAKSPGQAMTAECNGKRCWMFPATHRRCQDPITAHPILDTDQMLWPSTVQTKSKALLMVILDGVSQLKSAPCYGQQNFFDVCHGFEPSLPLKVLTEATTVTDRSMRTYSAAGLCARSGAAKRQQKKNYIFTKESLLRV